jgi:mRNA interferase RelE/StbE
VTYRLIVEEMAERDLLRLPREFFRRIADRIQSLAIAPRPPGCLKLMGSANTWRIRAGHYRIVYEIDDEKQIVRVTRVRHRKDVYR